jgi:hypothetical protein
VKISSGYLLLIPDGISSDILKEQMRISMDILRITLKDILMGYLFGISKGYQKDILGYLLRYLKWICGQKLS